MNFLSAGPSPAWLGVAGMLSFGGLVIAAFASGYHLASDAPPPRAVPVATRAERALGGDGSEELTGSGSIAEPLVDRARAVLRAQPVNGDVVDELPAGRSVTILRQAGEW
ncbi:MAG TPA: hypothetical protein VNN80_12200, partial [Polyangiaceae bacterium]|nr:hypothetical protein [Polyangiaceae bacterium]